jgi:hypothetical protein
MDNSRVITPEIRVELFVFKLVPRNQSGAMVRPSTIARYSDSDEDQAENIHVTHVTIYFSSLAYHGC